MKKLIVCLLAALMLLCFAALAEFEYENGYRIITGADGKYGLENERGEIVLEPVYDEIGGFQEWPDYVKRCWLIQDGKYGWYPAPEGGAAPCILEDLPTPFSRYVICGEQIWNLDGTLAADTLYSKITILNHARLAVWEFTGSKEKWDELYDSWGGRMDYASEEATILDTNLNPVYTLKCDYIDPTTGTLAPFEDFDVDPSGEKWDAGYIDVNTGEELCRKRTNLDLGEFRYDLARVIRFGTGDMNLIDMTFEKVYEKDYNYISPFIDGHNGAYAVLCNRIWEGGNITGYSCTLINEKLDELMNFEIGWDNNGVWCNGRIIVNNGDYDLYYVHDMDKRLLLKGKYVGPESDGLVRYQNEAGQWGYITATGKSAVPAAYADARDFSDGYGAVQGADGKWMFLDTLGRDFFGRSWDYVERFRDGYAYVRDETGGYMINTEGQKVRPALKKLHYIEDAYNPYTPVTEWSGEIVETYAESHGMRIFKADDGKYGVLDAEGKLLAPGVYDIIEAPRDYGNGEYRAILKRNNRYGWVSTDSFCDARWINKPKGVFAGLTIVEPENTDFFGSANVRWLVDAQGNTTDDISYASANILAGNMLALREKGSEITFVLDADFREVFSLECDGISFGSDGMCAFSKDALWGFCDLLGNVVAEAAFNSVSPFCDGYAVVNRHTDRDGEQRGLINKQGEMVIPFGKYENIYGFRDGYCIIRTEDHSYPDSDKIGSFIRPWHDYVIVDTDLKTCAKFTGNAHDNRHNGLFVYYAKDDDVLIDAQGNEILRSADIGRWTNGYCYFSENGLYGFLDEEGNKVIPARYKDTGDFGDNGLVAVQDEEGWKYVNAQGETAFTFDHNGGYPGTFADGYVSINYEWYVNEKGEKVAPMEVDGWF